MFDEVRFSRKKFGSVEERLAFLEDLSAKLGLQDLSGWYSVRSTTVAENGGGSLLSAFGSLANLLAATYPEHSWDTLRFKKVPFLVDCLLFVF